MFAFEVAQRIEALLEDEGCEAVTQSWASKGGDTETRILEGRTPEGREIKITIREVGPARTEREREGT